MRRSILIAVRQLGTWRHNFRVWAAFMLSLAFCIITTTRYIGFADAIGSSVQVAEAYIIIGSSPTYYSGILLGGLLLLSDAPFLTSRSPYEIIRVNKKCWFRGQMTYVAFSVMLYSVITALFPLIIVSASGRAIFDNQWSGAINLLASNSLQFAISEFKLVFPYGSIFSSHAPYTVFFLTILFNGCYCLLLGLCLFSVNVWFERNIGWLIAISIHILGYIIIMNGIVTSAWQRYSPLSSAFFVNQLVESSGVTPISAVALYALLYCIIIVITDRRVKMVTI